MKTKPIDDIALQNLVLAWMVRRFPAAAFMNTVVNHFHAHEAMYVRRAVRKLQRLGYVKFYLSMFYATQEGIKKADPESSHVQPGN